MKVFSIIEDWQNYRMMHPQVWGFVPTMGGLHEGHLSLVRAAKAHSEQVVVSIIVNPMQFDEQEDYLHYPKNTEKDLVLLRAEGVDAVLCFEGEALYPDDYQYQVIDRARLRTEEGLARKGHFEGVATVVLKLLHIVSPQKVFLGEKDWDQLQCIKGLVRAFFLPVEVVGCPVVREESGLAMSTRNARLSKEARQQAGEFYRLLSDSSQGLDELSSCLESAGFRVEYVVERESRRLGAVRYQGVRLIDNVFCKGGH